MFFSPDKEICDFLDYHCLNGSYTLALFFLITFYTKLIKLHILNILAYLAIGFIFASFAFSRPQKNNLRVIDHHLKTD